MGKVNVIATDKHVVAGVMSELRVRSRASAIAMDGVKNDAVKELLVDAVLAMLDDVRRKPGQRKKFEAGQHAVRVALDRRL